MGDEYRQLSQHRQQAHCAVQYERERDYLRAEEKQPARNARETPSSRI